MTGGGAGWGNLFWCFRAASRFFALGSWLDGAVDMGKRLNVSCSATLSYSEHGLLGRFKHRAGHKPQARMVARQVRPRLPDGRPRQGEGQAGLLPILFGEEEARGADKARLALGPSARKE